MRRGRAPRGALLADRTMLGHLTSAGRGRATERREPRWRSPRVRAAGLGRVAARLATRSSSRHESDSTAISLTAFALRDRNQSLAASRRLGLTGEKGLWLGATALLPAREPKASADKRLRDASVVRSEPGTGRRTSLKRRIARGEAPPVLTPTAAIGEADRLGSGLPLLRCLATREASP